MIRRVKAHQGKESAMKIKPSYFGLAVLIILSIIVITAALVPGQLNPAYTVAETFVKAAGKGDDALAMAQLSDALKTYVLAACPQGSVAACVDAYTPPEWGNFLNAVFRRSQPDGSTAWDIQYLATYAENQGFSGVCIYVRAEKVTGEVWQVVRWSGWISCDEPNAGLSALMRADAPHSAP
jgi:hypothetical protein